MLKIAFVRHHRAPVHEVKTMDFDQLAAMLGAPQVSKSKNGKGWMPAEIEAGARTGERVKSLSALVLDIEAKTSKNPLTEVKTVIGVEPPPFDEIALELRLANITSIAHTSYHHHDPAILPADVKHPRYRIVFALSRPLERDEIKQLAPHVAAMLGLADCVDTSCIEDARLFYMPRCPAERVDQFRHEYIKGAPLDVDALLEESRRESDALKQATAKQRDTSKPSVIDAFNDTYSCGDILEGNGYISNSGDRWMHPNSTTGLPGVRLLPDSTPERIFSSHSNDPLNDTHAHDAFDCYRILAHGGDFKSAVREAARLLGIGNKQNEAPQRDYSGLLSAGNASASQQACEEPEEPSFKRVSLADVLTNPPESQRYIWGERLPFDALSLLAAHGGTGKSLFSMQLAAHTATGNQFLGLPTEQIKTLFFSAEDSTNTIRRRFASICQADGLDPEEVERNLIVLDATAAPCLFHEVSNAGVRTGEPTAHYHELKAMIEAEGVGFLIVDNASDSFGANPIDRQAVTKFIRALVRLVQDAGGAVLLLSHVNKVTSRNGAKQSDSENYADSAAWHNAARSRLFLNADDKGGLTLAHNKNNYGKKQPVLNLAFREDGSSLQVVDAVQAGEFDGGIDPARDLYRLPVLKLIREYYKREEWISPAKESNTSNAYAMLRDDLDYPQSFSKRDCLAMLRDCERDGLLEKETYQKPSRHAGKRWHLTAKGLEFISESLPPAQSKEAELSAAKAKSEEVDYA